MSAVAEKKLALVGVGRISGAYLDVLHELPELVLSAAVEPDRERAEIAGRRGARVYASVCELLERGGTPDVAIVCTPPSTHAEVVERLLRAGVDCLIEKPLAIVPGEAQRICELAERLGRTLCTAGKFRVNPSLIAAGRAIAEGRIGQLSYVENTFTAKLDARASWHGDPQISGGGVWMDQGPHALDVVETVAGPIERIKMVEEMREQRSAVEDEVIVEAEHARGILSRILLSWNRTIAAPIARCVGTHGELLVGWAQTVVRDGDDEEVIGAGVDPRAAFLDLVRHFLARRAHLNGAEDHGAQALDWIHAGYRSRSSQRWEIA